MHSVREATARYKVGSSDQAEERPHVIDLFCGAGGMSEGFRQVGFRPVWANDFNEEAARTYRANFGDHCNAGDIVSYLERHSEEVPSADVVVGGPPCQGFSLLNKGKNGDPRRQLWRPYLDVVRLSGATTFVMENVPQLLDSPEFQEIREAAEAMGFRLATAKMLAADYGVPQRRLRAFVVGSNMADPNAFFPPKKTHYNPATASFNLSCGHP